MKNFLAFFALILFPLCIAFSLPEDFSRRGQDLVPARHWIYDSLQILDQECDIVQFSDKAPLSLNQIHAMLLEVDYDSLSEAGRLQYDRAISFFKEKTFSKKFSVLQVGTEPALNLEAFYKSNDDAFWVHDRYEKKRFLEVPVNVQLLDYASVFADFGLQINKSAMQKNGVYANVPYNADNFDVNFPHQAYGSFGTMFSESVGVNFRISNMAESFGRAENGSVVQSEFLTDATSAVLSIFSSSFEYSAGVTQFNIDRYMYSHKVDMRFFKKFQLSLMEACLPYAPMDLRFFNPAMVLHNYTSWLDYQKKGSDVGSYFGIKMNFSPIRHLRAYALWSMTQFQLPVEMSDDDEDTDNYVPNAMGFQLGLESYVPIKKGHLHLNAEVLYTQPYLYINSSPNWSFVRTSSESNGGTMPFYEWVGSRYGPDTVAASFKAEYEVPQRWALGFKYLFLARGQLSDPEIFSRVGWGPRLLDVESLDDWVYPYHMGKTDKELSKVSAYKDGRNATSPSGTAEYANVVSVYGNLFVTEWLSVFMQPSLAFISNVHHNSGENAFSFECALGAQLKFAKIR